MDTIDRNGCRLISSRIQAAMDEIGRDLGIKLSFIGSQKFTNTSATFKLEAAVVQNGTTLNRDAENFKRYARMYGLQPDQLGTTFTSNGDTFKLIGINPSRPKFPLLGERVKDGKRFKFQPQSIQRATAPVDPAIAAVLQGMK